MPLFAAPCLSGDGFEWRASERKVFVEGGEHTLRVYALDDGAKIRNVRFGERGSCGFTDSMPQDPAVVEYQTALCQHRLAGLGGVCPSTGAAVPGLEISLPDVCYSDCAGKSLCHFILQVIFLPRHPRRPAHSLTCERRWRNGLGGGQAISLSFMPSAASCWRLMVSRAQACERSTPSWTAATLRHRRHRTRAH